MHALNVTIRIQQRLLVWVLNNMQFLCDAQPALASYQTPTYLLSDSPLDKEIFVGILTRASVAPVVDALVVHPKSIFERYRCEPDVRSWRIVSFVTNVTVVDDEAYETASIERAFVWIPATARMRYWFSRTKDALVVPTYDRCYISHAAVAHFYSFGVEDTA